MSYVGCVGCARFSPGAHKPHALRANQQQVFKNVRLSLYGVSTFTLWGQTFTLWVPPQWVPPHYNCLLAATASRPAAHAAIATAVADHDGAAGWATRCVAHLIHLAHRIGCMVNSAVFHVWHLCGTSLR